MSDAAICYKNHHFLQGTIVRVVWPYYRFPLSLRAVDEMLFQRGIVVSCRTIRRWGRKDVTCPCVFIQPRLGPRPFLLRRSFRVSYNDASRHNRLTSSLPRELASAA